MRELVLHIVIVFLVIAGCNNKKQQVSDKDDSMQGKEGMEMNHQSKKSDTELNNIMAPANKMVISNAQIIHPFEKNISETINADGYIAFDERRNNKVVVRVAGRIEKLYLKYNFQFVNKGDKVLELYSPELNTYQEEYLHHLKTKSDSFLIDATKQKLVLLGLSARQFTEIERSGKPLKSITIYSLYDGFVINNLNQERGSSVQSVSAGSSDMNGMNGGIDAQQNIPENQMQSTERISEGQYVNKGQTLFVLNDCKVVNVIVALNANESAGIKLNLPVKIKSQLLPGEIINATIGFVEPSFREGQKFFQARVYLKNESLKLKVNSIVSVEFIETGKYLVVPSSSVLSLGKRKFVWLKKGNSQYGSKFLQAIEIKAGKQTSEYIQILSGITAQDEIAKNAGYLLDSESLIGKEAK